MKRAVLLLIPILILASLFAVRAAEHASIQETPVPTAAAAKPEPTPAPTPEPTPRPSETFYTEYDARNAETGETVKKQLGVYLPPAYDENGEYRAIFLMHVSGADETFWMNLGIGEILDGMISSGEIPPVVAFMPDGYISDEKRGNRNDFSVYTQFAAEFREDLIPFAREYYSLSLSRDDLAFYGASFGAYMTVNSVLAPNLDLVSNFGYVGGGTIEPARLEEGWNTSGCSELPVRMLYIGEGEMDDRGPVELSYMTLLNACEKFHDDNLKFTLMPGIGHDATEWTEGLKEALRLFFG